MEAKKAVKELQTLYLPKPTDQLMIVVDGAKRPAGIGHVMYALVNDKKLPVSFHSTKLSPSHSKWLSCEIEALAISASVSHFSPYVVQSQHHTTVLTDSKPCVDAFRKLCKGQFSLSARVTTYLSTVSRYKCEISHLKGSENTFADFQSRNPVACEDQTCQVCQPRPR